MFTYRFYELYATSVLREMDTPHNLHSVCDDLTALMQKIAKLRCHATLFSNLMLSLLKGRQAPSVKMLWET